VGGIRTVTGVNDAVTDAVSEALDAALDEAENEAAVSAEDMAVAVGMQYTAATPGVWHDEGGVHFDAWFVQVTAANYQCTYWFQTQYGAEIFVAERRAG
jgi:hypothetical protein